MASKIFYFVDALAGGSNHLEMQDGGVAPGQSVVTTGWIVGTLAPTRYCLMDSQTERASALHSGTTEPANPPNNIIGDCFRTSGTYNGSFAAGTWSFGFDIEGITRSTSTTDGRLRLRLWKGTDATGAGATLITGTVITSQYTNLANSAFQNISGSVALSQLTLTNEYLFLQVAHQLDGAGNNANADVHLAVGTNNHVATTNFSDLTPSQVSISDVGTSTDNLSQLFASLFVDENGLGTESLTLSVSLSVTDSGFDTETIIILQQIFKLLDDIGLAADGIATNTISFIADSITGQDNLTIQTQFILPDEILGRDYLDLSAYLPISDLGTELEVLTLITEAIKSVYDAGLGTDQTEIFVSFQITDIGTGADVLSILSGTIKQISDLVEGLDNIQISVLVDLNETGMSEDEISQLLASLSVNDYGTGVEIITKYDTSSTSDLIEIVISKLSKPTISIELVQPVVKFSLNTQ